MLPVRVSARIPPRHDTLRARTIKNPGLLARKPGIFQYLILGCRLYATLRQHGVGDFHEASDVGSDDVVDVAVGLGAVLHAYRVDVHHDRVEFCVDLFRRPGDTHRVLRHFEPRRRHAAGIGSLARGEEQLVLLEDADGIGG